MAYQVFGKSPGCLMNYSINLHFEMMNCMLPFTALNPTHGKFCNNSSITLMSSSFTRIQNRRTPKNLKNLRHSKLPPDFGVNLFLKKQRSDTDPYHVDDVTNNDEDEDEDVDGDILWEADEIEAISSMFQGRIPQKPGVLYRERPLPLPIPRKLRPLDFPTPKNHIKLASPGKISPRAAISNQVYKNPTFLIGLAHEIRGLGSNEDVSVVLNKCGRFLRKGSLSLTVRELGHMNLPERALQTFCWVQKQPHLYPDDRILASTVEVLARHHELKFPFNLEKFTRLASRNVLDSMVKGFIRGGNLKLALKLLSFAKKGKRMLDSSVYAKLILELGKNPDKHVIVVNLLNELAERDDLDLNQQDCTAIMKVGMRLGKFNIVESLFHWFKQSGKNPSVVMYTTMIHSRYHEKKYREALAIVWEMEGSDCLFDLPAYRVAIKLFVAINDLPRAVRYFSKLKEAGFSPTYDIYRDMIRIYLLSGRLAKCKEICWEVEMAGFKLDKHNASELVQIERGQT